MVLKYPNYKSLTTFKQDSQPRHYFYNDTKLYMLAKNPKRFKTVPKAFKKRIFYGKLHMCEGGGRFLQGKYYLWKDPFTGLPKPNILCRTKYAKYPFLGEKRYEALDKTD